MNTPHSSFSGPIARALLAAHLGAGPLVGLLGSGALVAVVADRSTPIELFLLLATPALALGFLPSTFTMLACGALYGWTGAVLLFPALVIASFPGFILVRRHFQADALALLHRHPSAETIVHRLDRWTFPVATLLRLAPVSTFAWTNALLSVGPIRPLSYLAATALGLLPRLILLVWAGRSAGDLTTALQQGTAHGTSFLALGLSVASMAALALLAGTVLTKKDS